MPGPGENNNFPENRWLTISFENVFDSQNNRMQLLNTPFIYDTDDPDVDTLVVLSENSLQVFFDEPLDITSAESINNYHQIINKVSNLKLHI